MLSKERMTGLLLSLAGIVFVLLSSRIETTYATGIAGPRLFPYISSILLIVFGVIIFIRNSDSGKKAFFTPTGWKRVAAMLGFLVLYPPELIYLGFPIASFITTLGLTHVFAMNKGISFRNKFIFTVIATIAVFLIFQYLLNILLPEGKWVTLLKEKLWN
jgi:hypothetical protein